MGLPKTFALEADKTVTVTRMRLREWGVCEITVRFNELNEVRKYSLEIGYFITWLESIGKTVDNFTLVNLRDFLIGELLPIYNRLEKVKKVIDRVKGWA